MARSGRIPQATAWPSAYTTGGTLIASQSGIRQGSDFYTGHDAVDAHKQSTLENLGDGAVASLSLFTAFRGVRAAVSSMRGKLLGWGARTAVSAAPPVTLIGQCDKLAQAAKKWIKPLPRVIDVVVHGSPDAFYVLHNGK